MGLEELKVMETMLRILSICKDENVEQLVKVTGKIRYSSINGIQLYFADGTDSPMIGEDDGTESTN